jgi:hypothetical protein
MRKHALTKHAFAVICVLFALTGIHGSAAQAPPPTAAGHWEGGIQTPGEGLSIAVDLARTGDTWEATIDIPAQSLKAFPLSGVAVRGENVGFAMPRLPGNPQFKGTVAKDGKQIVGEFRQAEQMFPFTMRRTGDATIERPPASTPVGSEFIGAWEGTLDANGQKLRLVLKLANTPAGPASASIISLDQGGAEIPAATVVQTGARLKVLLPAIAGTFEGEHKDAVLTGTWTQGPGTLPLVLTKQKP